MSLERERVWVLWRLPRERPQFANGVSTFISVKPPDIFNKISISSYFLAVLVAAKTTFLKSSKTSAVVTEPVNAKAWSFLTLTKWVYVPELNPYNIATTLNCKLSARKDLSCNIGVVCRIVHFLHLFWWLGCWAERNTVTKKENDLSFGFIVLSPYSSLWPDLYIKKKGGGAGERAGHFGHLWPEQSDTTKSDRCRKLPAAGLMWCGEKKRRQKEGVGNKELFFESKIVGLMLKQFWEYMRDERAVNDTRIEMTDRLTHQTSMSHSLPRRKAVGPRQLRDKLILADNRTVSSLMISKCYLE